MSQKYYTIRIRIANIDNIHLDIYDTNNQLIREPSGGFGFKDNVRDRILELHEKARLNELQGAEVEELGKLLFSALFAEGLRREFLDIYQKAQQENALLRLELDVDERQLPEVAALPWEFMYLPPGELHGALWLATAPNMVFYRRQLRLHLPESIQLKIGERLRIAVAVAAPKDLGPILYKKICNELNEMARTERFDVLEIVESANRISIDTLLEKKPHIFHFIGHGRLKDEKNRNIEQVAMVNSFGNADWVSADYFNELFYRFKPGLVLLHTSFGGIAYQVLQMNVPAVAAMQFEVSNATAQRFALEFYRRLAENEPVDKAVQEARRHIALSSPAAGSRDFATPILFMSIREGQLFQRQTDIPDKSKVISELKENAGRMEENASFNEAIKTWKDIRDLEPQHPGIEQALNRLEMKSKNQVFIRELLEKLSIMREELGRPVYLQVSDNLRRIGKQGIDDEDEVYIELVQNLIAEKLTVEEFIAKEQKTYIENKKDIRDIEPETPEIEPSSSKDISRRKGVYAPQVFLCHAHEDKKYAASLHSKLEGAGLRPWLDKENLRGGDRWDKHIRKAIKKVDYFVVLLSKALVKKIEGYVIREINMALHRKEEFRQSFRFIIPVKIEECEIPDELEEIQTIDLSEKGSVNVKELINTIKQDFEKRGK